MSAFAKSCTEILPPNLPKMEKKKIEVWGSELEELRQLELHILWSPQISCLLIKNDRLKK